MNYNISLDIYSILLFMSIGQLFLSVLYLGSKKRKNISTVFLILVLFIFSLNIIEPVFIKTRFLLSIPHLLYIGPFFLLLLGPTMYLYILSIKNVNFKWKTIYLLHLLPFVLSKIWMFPNFLQSGAKKKEIIHKFYEFQLSEEYINSSIDITSLLFQLHPLVYFFISVGIVLKDLKTPQTRFHKHHKIFIMGFTFVISFYLFGWFLLRSINIPQEKIYWKLLSIWFFIFACYLSYGIINNLLKPIKYRENILIDDKMIDLHVSIKEYMIRNKPYLSPAISLNEIANQMNLSAKLVSKIINRFEEKNFSDFINDYRITDAAKLIIDPKMKQYTIEAIAKEVGFSNKMSFNRAFKKFLNMTPTEYKSINE